MRAGWAKQIQVRLRNSGFGGTKQIIAQTEAKRLLAQSDQAKVKAGQGNLLGIGVTLYTVLSLR